MSKVGIALIALGVAILLLVGFVWRPQRLFVSGNFGIANADFEAQSNDRLIAAIGGSSLMVCGTILFAAGSLRSMPVERD